MRVVVMVQVNTSRGPVWLRRVLEVMPAAITRTFLEYPGANLTLDRDMRDPAGGVRMLCNPLDGDEHVHRLSEYLFEPCAAPV